MKQIFRVKQIFNFNPICILQLKEVLQTNNSLTNVQFIEKLYIYQLKVFFRRAGGSKVDFHFFVVSDTGKCQLSEKNFGINFFFIAKVIAFLNLKNTHNYIAYVNFNQDSPKIKFNIYLLLQFLR